MLRTITVCERNLQIAPPNVITLAANTATEIFPNDDYTKGPEIVTRYIQNLTGADVYLSFGLGADGAPVCDDKNMFHAVIQDKALFDCFPHRQRVCAYGGTRGLIATTKITRTDYSH